MSKEDKIKELLNNKEYINKLNNNYILNNNIKYINFIINKKPESYSRERQGRGNHFYNPKGDKMIEYKNEMLHQMSKEDYKYTRELLNKENYKLEIDCQFYLPIQKSSSIETTILKEMKLIQPMGRPDTDNYIKFILDSMHAVVYDDDSKVVSIKGEKFYSLNPRTEIHIKIIERN